MTNVTQFPHPHFTPFASEVETPAKALRRFEDWCREQVEATGPGRVRDGWRRLAASVQNFSKDLEN